MRLMNARIKSFQSFRDSGQIEFVEGVNLIIGQNNAGKSALLRALLPVLADDPHRGPAKYEAFNVAMPEVNFLLRSSGTEIREWALRYRHGAHFPVPPPAKSSIQRVEELFERPVIDLQVTRNPQSPFLLDPPLQIFDYTQGGTDRQSVLAYPSSGDLRLSVSSHNTTDSWPALLSEAWSRDVFFFTAERMTIGEAAPGYSARLLPNAANLPNVLFTLNGERGDTFSHLTEHLRDIFPTVGNVSVRSKPDNSFLEIRVWPTKAMGRVELSFPLNSSGTGVSQILALLTAIMTLDKAIVIIDEINSFLHPAAVKALLRILQTDYAQHQYIISTHSPEVISFSNPSAIHLVKRDGYESTVEKLDLKKVETLREVAGHLGVSMADVFAADRIIWVEGPTEELCFPFLFQQMVDDLPSGTIITSVASPGHFLTRRRDRELVYEIYNRLSAAASALVVGVAFSFDTEKLTEIEKQDMQRTAQGRLHFLPRRHFECYLVDAAAIAAFIISKDDTSNCSVTISAVEVALKESAGERPFLISEWNGELTDDNWLARVDAANLIQMVCGKLTEHRVRFSKTHDSLFLMRHILQHDPSKLMPLKTYVESLVNSVAAS
jgi:predicted ATPase